MVIVVHPLNRKSSVEVGAMHASDKGRGIAPEEETLHWLKIGYALVVHHVLDGLLSRVTITL